MVFLMLSKHLEFPLKIEITNMYWIIYGFAIRCYYVLLWLLSFFNQKAQDFVSGRKTSFPKAKNGSDLWIHVSSLGEFEQARPLIEQLKRETSIDITLTFFSPSGFAVRKNYEVVDRVLYIPMDTYAKAKEFIRMYDFKFVVFVKYDFWMNHLRVCQEMGIPIIFISVILRPDQIYFGIAKRFYLPVFSKIRHFFVQNEDSVHLLHSQGINQVTLVGDTRIDRVLKIAESSESISALENLEDTRLKFVIGSAWPSDKVLLDPLFKFYKEQFLFIVAPHDVSSSSISSILSGHKNIQRYSSWKGQSEFDFLVIDNIGMLASLYSYADYTYVGGAFKGTLHNTLEAAAHGKPVFLGEHVNNQKFKEAVDLTQCDAAYSFSSFDPMKKQLDLLLADAKAYEKACHNASNYVKRQSGATRKIFDYIQPILS